MTGRQSVLFFLVWHLGVPQGIEGSVQPAKQHKNKRTSRRQFIWGPPRVCSEPKAHEREQIILSRRLLLASARVGNHTGTEEVCGTVFQTVGRSVVHRIASLNLFLFGWARSHYTPLHSASWGLNL